MIKVKVFALSAFALFAGFATANAAKIYVRDANVGAAQSERRDEVTQMASDAVMQMGDQQLAASESSADEILQPTLTGREGSYSIRIDRLVNARIVASTEQSVAAWRDLSKATRLATTSVLSPSAPGSAGQRTLGILGGSDPRAPAAENDQSPAQIPQQVQVVDVPTNATAAEAEPSRLAAGTSAEGETRGLNPIERLRRTPGFWSIGAGPGFGIGMATEDVMYSTAAAYTWELNPRFAVKTLGEVDLGSGSDNARMFNIGVGGDVYIPEVSFMKNARPYATFDLGLASARNQASRTRTGLSLGTGAGFRFAVSDATNMDVALHYEILTAQLDGANPSVFGLRAALNF